MARGVLIGGTSGRTTLAGEGLQHQDGHSHVLAYSAPALRAYDPAFAYEIAVIVEDGIRRMVRENENVIYYLTVANEFYKMPPMPEGVEEGILRGLYRFKASPEGGAKVHLLGSGAILNEALGARKILERRYGVGADVWSATSYKALYHDAIEAERWNVLHAGEEPRVPYVSRVLRDENGVFVAASDYLKALPASIAKWVPGPLVPLGTDGYGRSDSRAALRDYFEVDARHMAAAALGALAREGEIEKPAFEEALRDLVGGIAAFSDPERGIIEREKQRLEFAKGEKKRTIEDVTAQWGEAIASIRSREECPEYDGLVIAPQMGLVPIGRDRQSSLWEFAHIQTGTMPTRDEDGELVLGEESGIVFVLIPGGTFRMGAVRPDEEHPEGSPNVDPHALEHEGPVQEVTLAPFFLSKFEMTQGQWHRNTGENPS